MENERIKTGLNKLIETLINQADSVSDMEELDEIRKQLNQPEEPQGYQGLNKWYWCADVVFYPIKQNKDNLYGYGYSYFDNEWNGEKTYMHSLLSSRKLRLATPSEIKQAILKGCEQKGIVNGAKVKVVDCVFEIQSDSVYYNSTSNRLFIDDVKVFDNGKFAEVVKETKPSDKELLKECDLAIRALLNKKSVYPQSVDGEKFSELLLKIEQTLKP